MDWKEWIAVTIITIIVAGSFYFIGSARVYDKTTTDKLLLNKANKPGCDYVTLSSNLGKTPRQVCSNLGKEIQFVIERQTKTLYIDAPNQAISNPNSVFCGSSNKLYEDTNDLIKTETGLDDVISKERGEECTILSNEKGYSIKESNNYISALCC